MGGEGKRRLEASDLFRVRMVNDPDAARDGSRIAYTVTELDEKENRYRSAIWFVEIAGGEPRPLTSGRHRDGQPRWSPDGRTIAFTSDRNPDDKGKGQIWLVPVDGGEPTRLTALSESVEDFAWSPDGSAVVLVSKVRHGDPPSENGVRVIRSVRFRYDGEGYLDDKYRQLFVVDVATGKARQLTQGPFEHRHPAWSPTGREIAFASNRDNGWEFSPVADIYALRLNGNAVRKVSDGTGAWSQPAWSPDGTRIACYGTRRLDSDSPRTEVFIVPAGGGAPASLTADFDRSFRDGAIADVMSYPVRAPLWSAAGRDVSAVFSDQGSVHVARIGVADGEIVQVTRGRRRAGAIARTPDGPYIFAANDAVAAGEICTADAAGGGERRITRHNDAWSAEVELSQPEPFSVPSSDGTPIHGWIMKPVGYEPGTRYPMVLEIHGGPFGMYAETLMHEFQLFAARGYAVLFTNPRGSTGYGDAFAGHLFRAWGINDFPDLMAAVDWAIEQPYVDPQRLGVLGGSYGGFMTNWVITHTTRFKAAMTQRTLSNMYSTYGTDDIYYASAKQTIGAVPWEDPEIYWKLSPLQLVRNVETPLLIEMQEEDWRCPPEQSEQLFIALKRLGKTVEMVRYPGESHGMSRTGQPKHRIERLNRMMEWFDRYL